MPAAAQALASLHTQAHTHTHTLLLNVYNTNSLHECSIEFVAAAVVASRCLRFIRERTVNAYGWLFSAQFYQSFVWITNTFMCICATKKQKQ